MISAIDERTIGRRLKNVNLTRPPQARQDAPLPFTRPAQAFIFTHPP